MWRLKVPFHPTHRAFPWTGVLWLGAASQFWPVWDAAFTWIQRILLFHLLCYKNNTNWNNYDTCPNEPTVLVRLVLWKTINRLHPGIYSKRRQQMLSPPTKRANSVNCDTAVSSLFQTSAAGSATAMFLYFQLSETRIHFWSWDMTFTETNIQSGIWYTAHGDAITDSL